MASVTNQSSPAVAGLAVTPADGVVLLHGTCRSLFVGGAGNVSAILANDTVATTFVGCAAGQILPIMCNTVQLTGTTATSIVALY